jgi:hypothetical protein
MKSDMAGDGRFGHLTAVAELRCRQTSSDRPATENLPDVGHTSPGHSPDHVQQVRWKC